LSLSLEELNPTWPGLIHGLQLTWDVGGTIDAQILGLGGITPVLPDYSTLKIEAAGIFQLPDGVAQVSLRLNKQKLTGQVKYNGQTRRLNGRINAQGEATFSVAGFPGNLRVAVSRVQSDEGEAVGEPYFEIAIGDGFSGPLWPFAATGRANSRFVMAGWKLTSLLLGDEAAALRGFATLQASAKGVLRVVGRSADGQPFTASARAVRNQQDELLSLPLLVRRASDGADISGELSLKDQPAEDGWHVSGSLRQRVTGAEQSSMEVFGLRWERPASGTNPLSRSASSADVTVAIDDLTRSSSWPAANRLKDSAFGLQLSVSPVKGSFAGKLMSGDLEGKLLGVLFQDEVEVEGTARRGTGVLVRKGGGVSPVVIALE